MIIIIIGALSFQMLILIFHSGQQYFKNDDGTVNAISGEGKRSMQSAQGDELV